MLSQIIPNRFLDDIDSGSEGTKSKVMFDKVLIANRGAIACRIIRTLHFLGCKAVVIYHEQDKHSLHVQQADEAYSLGAGSIADTYLNQDKIIDIAKSSGANAIHPGYGFLSENPDFSEKCAASDIVFLGPTAHQMLEFGLKHRARELAQQSNVPLLPGSELLTDLDDAIKEASLIGYPVMLKSTAGGGGIGMQICHSEQELAHVFASVKRLSANNFSNDGVFLEKFVERARHIEVQIFGDGRGNVIAIGERDCSLQRRNQKVLEETPAPRLREEVRQALHATAQQLGASVNYRSAGTVEFIYDDASEQFYFLEMNTRLQVEHGVTEQVFGIDLVAWMVRLGAAELSGNYPDLNFTLKPSGHSVQARVYAEDPARNFQPCAGLLSRVEWPKGVSPHGNLRIDSWVESGTQVPSLFDPMLAKVIATADTREAALQQLSDALGQSNLYGIETNIQYLRAIIADEDVKSGNVWTQKLNRMAWQDARISVISAGTQTTVQDLPGRVGYWDIGVPPSGPFDGYSFALGNKLLGNSEDAAGLEITLKGPVLEFGMATQIVLSGATTNATITRAESEISVPFFTVFDIQQGDILDVGTVSGAGTRAYLLLRGGLDCPDYLESKSTFTLGQFGGHNGRSLLPGDVLHCLPTTNEKPIQIQCNADLLPSINDHWEIRVIYGPHGAPDFFTDKDIETFFASDWEVHFNSSRTGVRLIGPKPEWARTDGGEAGLHPSNIHDNAYAIGAIDFTGDMPVILGPDGPSLGGFVCPATVISADLWKLGQLKAGNTIRFIPVAHDDATALAKAQNTAISSLSPHNLVISSAPLTSAIVAVIDKGVSETTNDGYSHPTGVVYRAAGDNYMLVEYGPLQLDIRLRFRAHALMEYVKALNLDGILELTPGIRSLQIHYDSQQLDRAHLLQTLMDCEAHLGDLKDAKVPSRIVWLPLSWNDIACQEAVDKYVKSVRADAPWCPDNIEFIRRINGLESIDEVKRIVFDANYLVMGLGDVYLGAPVATPIDPRHRLVTTKYNPARTWTAENSVGIGGAYMCVYGMEGPGGYQFVGRTLQMWNRYKKTVEFTQPWLLRFFDQIRFYEVSHDELTDIREQFPHGQYPLKIEETEFSLDEYEAFLANEASSIHEFQTQRQSAFQRELDDWKAKGLLRFETDTAIVEDVEERVLAADEFAVESHVSGNVWQVLVEPGQQVTAGQTLLILESMKMEIEISAHKSGTIVELLREAGQSVGPGKTLIVLKS